MIKKLYLILAYSLAAVSPVLAASTPGAGGASGTPIEPTTTVGASSAAILNAGAATTFIKLCVPLSAANGIWVNWAGATAVLAAPSEYITPGQCASWIKSSGFLPTAQINAIASASVGVTLIYN